MKALELYNSLLYENKSGSLSGIKVLWMGTAGLYISDGKSSFLIDPYVSRFSIVKYLPFSN